MLRFILAVFAALAFAVPAAAQIDIMAPFNADASMDDARVLAKDLPFADGDRKKLDIYGPNEIMEPAPVVMFIYGGAWKQGRKEDYQFVGKALAANGFVVVIPDYRLYPEVTYPEFLVDNAQAVKWIEDNIEDYGGDTSRFFLAGHSAGAYGAVMLGLEKAFLNEFNVTMPIKGIAGLSGPYDFYPFEYDEVRNVFGQNDNPQGTQPINLVAKDRPPMLLLSGRSDPIVRFQNTQHFAEKAREAGNWVTEVYYDGIGHMDAVFAIGAMWRFRAPVLDDMVAFFTQFGAFPSGAPRQAYAPEPPAGVADIQATIAGLDAILSPIQGDHGTADATAATEPSRELPPGLPPQASPSP